MLSVFLTLAAAVMHSILVLLQANTLNVAFNSHNKSLLTIMMSNNVCNYHSRIVIDICYRLNTYGCRAFSVAGPTVWNSLLDFIWDPTISAHCLRRLLKTYLFARC